MLYNHQLYHEKSRDRIDRKRWETKYQTNARGRFFKMNKRREFFYAKISAHDSRHDAWSRAEIRAGYVDDRRYKFMKMTIQKF